MNWGLLAIIVFLLYTIGTLAGVSVYAQTHPKESMDPTRWRSKMESLYEKLGKVIAYPTVLLVVIHLLFGIALLAISLSSSQ